MPLSGGTGGPPEISKGYNEHGKRIHIDPEYTAYPWNEFGYLTGSIRSFIAAVEGEGEPWITGHDLRQALEVAIAAKHSARLSSVPVQLPLADRFALSVSPTLSLAWWRCNGKTSDP